MKQGISFVVAIIAVLALGVSVAVAASNTSVTIKTNSDSTQLEGKVKSSKEKCVKNRRVNLFWDAPGPPTGFQKVAHDTSGNDGGWSIAPPGGGPVPAGDYYVKVKPDGACDKAKSRTITVLEIM